MSTQTFEPNKLLALGEKLRENPQTILLSLPIFGWGILWFKLAGDKDGLAGAFGHLGLAFKLYYKHHWQNKSFLKISYHLLSEAAKQGTGNGQPSVRMVMGSIALDLGNNLQAKWDYELAIRMSRKIKDFNQTAFIMGHLGRVKTILGDFVGAKKDLDRGLKILSKTIKRDKSPRLQIWISNLELAMSEWYLACGDKKKAKLWAIAVSRRSHKYDLKTRKLDANNLLSKISASIVPMIIIPYGLSMAWIKY
jgi:tetratricopeptide (TPR) repeat protein